MESKSHATRGLVADENETVVRYLFERVYSKGELHHLDSVVTADVVGNSTDSSRAHLGPDGIRTHVIRLRTVFHEFTIEITDLHVVGNTFEVSWTARGTHERRYQGIDPTCTIGRAGEEPRGNRIAIAGDSSGTVRDGRIHEYRMVWNLDELRRQLGVPTSDSETGRGTGGWAEQVPPILEGTARATVSTPSARLDGRWR